MKCGRELKGELNFCAACQKEMERFPVNPTTPVQLPVRPSGSNRKKNRSRRSIKPEERIARLKSTVRWLVFALVITLIAFGLTVAAALLLLDQRDHRPDPGQDPPPAVAAAWNVSRETFSDGVVSRETIGY